MSAKKASIAVLFSITVSFLRRKVDASFEFFISAPWKCGSLSIYTLGKMGKDLSPDSSGGPLEKIPAVLIHPNYRAKRTPGLAGTSAGG
jgi:hypothetical protein